MSLLHVKSGDSGASSVESGSFLTVESNGNSAIQMLSGTSSNNYIYFGDSGDTNTGSIQYSHGANALILRVNGGTESLRITSGGNLNIGGNYTQTTYTSQITGTLNVTGNITQNGVQVATTSNSVTTGKAIAMAMIFG
jgi:hypothetical protein